MAYTSPIAWSTIEDALVAWVVAATGLTCVWANADAPQPAYPYVTLDWVTGPTRVGWDCQTTDTDSGADAGEEVTVNVGGPRMLTLGVNVYSDSDSPTTGAREYASRIEASSQLPTEKQRRTTAGIALHAFEPMQDLSTIAGAETISRVALDVRLSVASNITEEPGPYINTIQIGSDDLDYTDKEFGGTT